MLCTGEGTSRGAMGGGGMHGGGMHGGGMQGGGMHGGGMHGGAMDGGGIKPAINSGIFFSDQKYSCRSDIASAKALKALI